MNQEFSIVKSKIIYLFEYMLLPILLDLIYEWFILQNVY